MRVGFDVSPLHRPHPRGLVRITRELVRALERRGRIEIVRLTPPDGARLAAWRQLELPRVVRTLGLAGIHSCVSAFPLRGGGRRVQTIHELPWRHGVRENAGVRHRAWAALGPLRADAVVTATEFTARDLSARVLPGRAKIRVIPWGIGAPFADEPELGSVDEVVLGRYRLPQSPLVLCLGAVRPKKNLAAVVRGLAVHVRRGGAPVQLVVSGGDTPQLRKDLGLVARLGLSRFVSTPDAIDEADLPALLRLANAVAVLSRSEGFGLPVLEAMASATPVIVAQGTAPAEVAGSPGIHVDPDDSASVADGLERALRERESLRVALVSRAREFSWDRTAQGVESIWESFR
jgi:glycosyltransferase involved in cell wall biosynthesis